MKNLFLLPTDKPSRLYEFGNQFNIQDKQQENFRSFNINITSNEEIKEGDWYYDTNDNESLFPIYRRSQDPKFYSGCKKIILTTDQDLIKYGVQAIDDDFLEWFVKNPSCESVEVFKLPKQQLSSNYYSTINWIDNNIYKIIISKEEHKQETLEELKKWKQEALIAHEINQKVIEKLMAEKKLMYSEEEVELIANEMVNWAIDNIGNPLPQSGKKFDEVIAKFKNK